VEPGLQAIQLEAVALKLYKTCLLPLKTHWSLAEPLSVIACRSSVKKFPFSL
jgi:hypothetical protein